MSEAIEIATPEGRLINGHLFVKSAYTDPRTQKPGTPYYTLEMAFDPKDIYNSKDPDALESIVAAAIEEKWGEQVWDDYDVRMPFLEGDDLKKRRERKGKEGEAYGGKTVIRAKTIYNKDGEDDVGGIEVYDEAVQPIAAAQKGQIYNGCMGIAVLSINLYEDNAGNPAAGFYLKAFQKTGDGERLRSHSDRSGMFKPIKTTGKRPARRVRGEG